MWDPNFLPIGGPQIDPLSLPTSSMTIVDISKNMSSHSFLDKGYI